MTQPLQPPDSFHLLAAHGWLELDNHFEAEVELEKIAPELRAHPDVLNMRWAVFAKAQKQDAGSRFGQIIPTWKKAHWKGLYVLPDVSVGSSFDFAPYK